MYINLEAIFLRYGDNVIFENLNYKFNEGLYIVRGKSGIGKTTLLNLVAGYIKPDSGNVFTQNAKISYLMQETVLFSNLTVRENIYVKFASTNIDEKALDNFIFENLSEIGLSSDLQDKKVSLLSGGQKRKLELLLLSMDQSDVVLLDEPFANLDENSINQMISYIERKLLTDKIVIISSHSNINFNTNVQNLDLIGGVIKTKNNIGKG